jgi:hypothetical protein
VLILGRIGCCKILAYGVQVCGGLNSRNARFETADQPNVAGGAKIEVSPAARLAATDEGHPEVGCKVHLRAVERRGCHAQDSEGVLVEQHDASDDRAIALEVVLPIRIAEHEVACAVLAMFIGCVEEPAEIRTDVQYIKVIAADLVEPCGCGISVAAEPARVML